MLLQFKLSLESNGTLHFLLLWTTAVVMNELANFPPSIPLNRKLFDLVSEMRSLLNFRFLETARIFIRILILAFSYYFLAFAAAVLHDVGISGIFSKSAFCSKAYSLHWEQHSLNLGYCAKAAAVKIRFGGKNIYSEYGLNPKRRFLVIPTLSWLFEKENQNLQTYAILLSSFLSYFSSVLSKKNCFLFV